LLQQLDRLGTVPFGKGEAPETDQAALFEAPRPLARLGQLDDVHRGRVAAFPARPAFSDPSGFQIGVSR
jgi:hypothetical protein